MAEEPAGRFRDDGRCPSRRGDLRRSAIGMLGYAFMGKAHSNALKKIAYMTGRRRSRRGSSRSRAATRRPSRRRRAATATRSGRPTGATWSTTRTSRSSTTAGPNDVHLEPTSRRRKAGQARHLREAARPDGRRELRDLEGRRRDRREGDDRVQLPLLPGDRAREGDDRRRRARRDLPLPGALPPGVDHGSASSRRSGGSTRRSPAPGRSATSARTSSTSRATSSATRRR